MTGTIWLEDFTMNAIAERLQHHLKKFPHLEIISISHTALHNNRISAWVAMRDVRPAHSRQENSGDAIGFTVEVEPLT